MVASKAGDQHIYRRPRRKRIQDNEIQRLTKVKTWNGGSSLNLGLIDRCWRAGFKPELDIMQLGPINKSTPQNLSANSPSPRAGLQVPTIEGKTMPYQKLPESIPLSCHQ